MNFGAVLLKFLDLFFFLKRTPSTILELRSPLPQCMLLWQEISQFKIW